MSTKLTAEQVREAIEANSWAETSTIREFNDSSWQAIADELNAALGALEPHSNQLEPSRWHELFGTPERAARTLARMCAISDGSCAGCPMFKANLEHCNSDYTHLKSIVEWLRGDAE